MVKRKREHFAELMTFDNVLKNPPDIKGKWRDTIFKNDVPIMLELGCGRADLTLDMAIRYPENNYIGIDKKGARVWAGAKKALEEALSNVFFLLILIDEITDYFEDNEVDGIWITFPDPYPKVRHAKHRLTSVKFLEAYRKILKKDAHIHLKTDDDDLFDYSVAQITEFGGIIHQSIDDIYAQAQIDEIITLKTTYEKKHLAIGRKIKYLRFSLG